MNNTHFIQWVIKFLTNQKATCFTIIIEVNLPLKKKEPCLIIIHCQWSTAMLLIYKKIFHTERFHRKSLQHPFKETIPKCNPTMSITYSRCTSSHKHIFNLQVTHSHIGLWTHNLTLHLTLTSGGAIWARPHLLPFM